MKIADREFKDYTYIMAIINLTPDSFFAGSRNDESTVLRTAEKAVRDGAAIIDIGAQSTRPGYTEITAAEEIARFEKPLRMIKSNFDIPVSVDTYFSESARAALALGADMVNDVWGLTHDADMAATVAEFGASVCIMHNAAQRLSGDIWQPIKVFLRNSVKIALGAGIDGDKICLDGGVGFAKDAAQNIELAENYEKLADLGYPLLLGVSRKSMFGGRVEDRLPQTVAMTEAAAKKGVLFVRVHDVKENAEAVRRVYGY